VLCAFLFFFTNTLLFSTLGQLDKPLSVLVPNNNWSYWTYIT